MSAGAIGGAIACMFASGTRERKQPEIHATAGVGEFTAENVVGMIFDNQRMCKLNIRYLMYILEDGEPKAIPAPMVTRIGIIDIRELEKDRGNEFYRNYLRGMSSMHDDYPNPYYKEPF